MFPFDQIDAAVHEASKLLGEATGLSKGDARPTFNVAAWAARRDAHAILKPLVEHRPELIEALGASFGDPAALEPALAALAQPVRIVMRYAVKDGLPAPEKQDDVFDAVSGEQQIAEELTWLTMALAYAAVSGVATWEMPRDAKGNPLVWADVATHPETSKIHFPKQARWANAAYRIIKPWVLARFGDAMASSPPPPPPPPPGSAGSKRLRLQARLSQLPRLEHTDDARAWFRLPAGGARVVRPQRASAPAGAMLLAMLALGPAALVVPVLHYLVGRRASRRSSR